MTNQPPDEVRCDHCGQPTPQLYPPVDIELCDACWAASPFVPEDEDEPELAYAVVEGKP